jgi:hypothetical protein
MRQVILAPRTLVVVVTDVDVDEETKKNLGCLGSAWHEAIQIANMTANNIFLL